MSIFKTSLISVIFHLFSLYHLPNIHYRSARWSCDLRMSFSKKMLVIALTTLIMCDTTWAGMRNELPRDGNEENAKTAISHGGQILTKSLPRVTSPFNIPGITSLSVNRYLSIYCIHFVSFCFIPKL